MKHVFLRSEREKPFHSKKSAPHFGEIGEYPPVTAFSCTSNAAAESAIGALARVDFAGFPNPTGSGTTERVRKTHVRFVRIRTIAAGVAPLEMA
ncbi:hypothetical protein [Saccharopolyspora dendranthemae]|uniref:hypothetical protein n=1 Tax=Saccharopolyspora dendranthemae TaxID=1181886 RepID=UPI0011A18E7D|nr:hypothetical protein [Saccharopolyspora dendranthemae]